MKQWKKLSPLESYFCPEKYKQVIKFDIATHKCDSNSAFAESVLLYCYEMSHGVLKVRMGLV